MMSWKETIRFFAERSNISEPLTQNMITLSGFLEKFLKTREGEDLIELSAKLQQWSAKPLEEENASANSELKARIREWPWEGSRESRLFRPIFSLLANSREQH